MTLSVKSNEVVKHLVELSKFQRYAYSGENTYVSYKAEWVDLTANNQKVNLPGGQALTKIGQLPANCSHPNSPLGVFGLLTSNWEPSGDLVYVAIQSDGAIMARSKTACQGVLYFHWMTNQMSINSGGGYKNPITLFKRIYTGISKLTRMREEACLCL